MLLCYFSFVGDSRREQGQAEIVDVLDVVDWHSLAKHCDPGSSDGTSAINSRRSTEETLGTSAERYIWEGTGTVKISGFVDGKETQLDMVR